MIRTKNILRSFFYQLGPHSRMRLRRAVFLPVDLWEKLSGKRSPMTPPRGLIYTGSGEFLEHGRRFKKYFIELGKLSPSHSVLDIGSGIGRMAIPLTQYLNDDGSYEGFDVVKTGVQWCKKHISAKFPAFQFQYIPLKNDLYTSDGMDAAQFRFPYPDEAFDFVFLTSVFTHMLPDQVENYLKEIDRVLKKGGRCLATFFLLDEASKDFLNQQDHFNFPYNKGHYRLMSQATPSANVAYEKAYLKEFLASQTNLSIETVKPGYWSGRPRSSSLEFQDILVLKK